MLLTGCRLDEWASARFAWLDFSEALIVIPSDEYKSDHVHIVPLVPQAMEILKRLPEPRTGDYLLSSTGGSKPIQGISKYYRTRLVSAIISNTGARLTKKFTVDGRRSRGIDTVERSFMTYPRVLRIPPKPGGFTPPHNPPRADVERPESARHPQREASDTWRCSRNGRARE